MYNHKSIMHTKVAYNVWQHSTLHCTRGSLSDNKIQNIVDKYTVEYITVLTQAQSSLNHGKSLKTMRSGIKANRFGTNIGKYSEIRQENDMSKENEATEEHSGWTRMEHFKHKNMTHTDTVPLSWSQMFNKKRKDFLQQLMGAPIPQP